MSPKVKFLGYGDDYNTVNLFHSKFVTHHKYISPSGEVAPMNFMGALNFYLKLIEKFYINLTFL